MSGAEERILAYVDAHADEQLRFVIDLCNQNSFTGNKAGVDRVAEMIRQRLSGALPAQQIFAETEYGDQHALRTREGRGGICLIGHLDTVFAPGHPFQQCRVEGDRLCGPGTGDMKGGLAVFVYALLALREAGVLSTLAVSLLLNGDEEAGSIRSRGLFQRETKSADLCLCAECSGPNGEVVVSRNGKLGARLQCFGEARHVGRETHEKSSAILELAGRIIALESLNATFPGISLNVGRVEGGLGATTIAGEAAALIDIRWVDEAHHKPLLERVEREIARVAHEGCRSELHILNSRPAWSRQGGSDQLLDTLQSVGASLGQRIESEHRRGSSDANFFGSAGVATIDGLGPWCKGDHTPEERISIRSLRERTALVALFLARLGREGSANLPGDEA